MDNIPCGDPESLRSKYAVSISAAWVLSPVVARAIHTRRDLPTWHDEKMEKALFKCPFSASGSRPDALRAQRTADVGRMASRTAPRTWKWLPPRP
jgi:hypothetical protein